MSDVELTRKQIIFRADQHEMLRQYAFKNRKSMSEVVRQAVDNFLTQEGNLDQYSTDELYGLLDSACNRVDAIKEMLTRPRE